MSEIEIIKTQLDSAETLQGIFGTSADGVRKIYAMLAKAVYPDTHPNEKTLADETFGILSTFYAQAQAAIKNDQWGTPIPIPGREKITIAGKYVRHQTLAAGDISDVHWGLYKKEPIIIKVARHSSDNDLLVAEKTNLETIRKKMAAKAGDIWQQCIPEVVDSFLLSEGAGTKRRVNILNGFTGFLTLQHISNKIPEGLDGRTVVWMWKRLMILLDWTFRSGIVHGAVLPPHIMFYPDNDGSSHRDVRKHAIRLVDWCYSIEHKNRTRLSSWIPQYQSFYAPEILEKKTLDHSTDMYMAAKTMLSMCRKDVPHQIPDSIKRWVDPNRSKRPSDTLQYFEDFKKVQTDLYGAPKWHDFNVPGGPAQLVV